MNLSHHQLIQNMERRAAQCRRLGRGITDEHARTALLTMAEQIEADIRKLQEQAARG
jgi:hypothetical protein